MELVPNLHLIEGERSNIYFWLGDSGPAMIDAGRPNDRDSIINYMAKIVLELAELKAIFVTHADLNHAGAVASIQVLSGAAVFACPESNNLLKAGKSPNISGWLTQFIIDYFMSYLKLLAGVIQVVNNDD